MKLKNILFILLLVCALTNQATAQTSSPLTKADLVALQNLDNNDHKASIKLCRELSAKIINCTERKPETELIFLSLGLRELGGHISLPDTASATTAIKYYLDGYDKKAFQFATTEESLKLVDFKTFYFELCYKMEMWEYVISYGKQFQEDLSLLSLWVAGEKNKEAVDAALAFVSGTICDHMGNAYLKQNDEIGASTCWHTLCLVAPTLYYCNLFDNSNAFYHKFAPKKLDMIPNGAYRMENIKWKEQNIKDGNVFLYVGERRPFNSITAGYYKVDGRYFYEYFICPSAIITPAKIDSCGFVGESFFRARGFKIPYGKKVETEFKKIGIEEDSLLQILHDAVQTEEKHSQNPFLGCWQLVSDSLSIGCYKIYSGENRSLLRERRIFWSLPAYPGNYQTSIVVEPVEYRADGNTIEAGNPCTITWLTHDSHKLQYKTPTGKVMEETWKRCQVPDYLKMDLPN